jgi:ribonuclease T2
MKVEQKKFFLNVVFILVATAIALWFNFHEETEASKETGQQTSPAVQNLSGDYILALSWQPAFCEGQPSKPECRSQKEGRFDTVNFSLHGLWPQPEDRTYCDPSLPRGGGWSRLPQPELSESLRRELETRMPGYRSYLHRHEWIKHGTCIQGITAEDYFRLSLDLLNEINASLLIDYVSWNIGRRITLSEAAKQMDESFGKGAGKRLSFVCKRDAGRNLVSEFRIALRDPDGDGLFPLNEHILAAPALRSSCKSGIVDRAGLQ